MQKRLWPAKGKYPRLNPARRDETTKAMKPMRKGEIVEMDAYWSRALHVGDVVDYDPGPDEDEEPEAQSFEPEAKLKAKSKSE